MAGSSNDVFISYRRDVGGMIAMALFQSLTDRGVDAFYDIETIRAGQFETIILNEIAARPYFLLVLTPGTLERCGERRDWVRREIDHALATERMIVPAYTPSFDFADLDRFLPRRLAQAVKGFNGQEVPQKWFKFAVQQLVDEFLLPIELESVERSPTQDEAVEHIRKRAQATPTVTDVQLSAHEHFEQGVVRPNDDLEGRLADYDEAIRLDPEYAAAYNNRGVVRDELGELDKAIADYEEAIRLDPTFGTAYSNRGVARGKLGDHKRAIADYDEAIRLDPTHAMAHFNRGFARGELGDLEAAVVDFDEGIRLNPTYALAFNNRGFARAALGDLKGAIADYDEAIRLDPTYALAFNNRGLARKQLGEVERAIADYDEAIRLDPANALAYFNRAHARSGVDLKGAIADAEMAAQLDPEDEDLKELPLQLRAQER